VPFPSELVALPRFSPPYPARLLRQDQSRVQAAVDRVPGAACVGALVDRFSHHCHPIDVDAESWRNKESLTFHKKPATHGQDADKAKKSRA
jgi:hypothetical protein